MNTVYEDIRRLELELADGKEICCSNGIIHTFPPILMKPFRMTYVGLIICKSGNFSFTINGVPLKAEMDETVFLSEECDFCVTSCSGDLSFSLLFYRINPIRELLGSSVFTMYLYTILTPNPCYVWNTKEENDISNYASLLSRHRQSSPNPFDQKERKLLLLSLTYRLCSLYSKKAMENNQATGHKIDTFIQLIKLIDKYFTLKRSVSFYADKLCLSPKYLSALSKSVCGYTVQELIFKSIIRKTIQLLKNSNTSIQEISDYFHFPNASAFGTFFKKQTGLSPSHYRKTDID